jgi:hypothetical protein
MIATARVRVPPCTNHPRIALFNDGLGGSSEGPPPHSQRAASGISCITYSGKDLAASMLQDRMSPVTTLDSALTNEGMEDTCKLEDT